MWREWLTTLRQLTRNAILVAVAFYGGVVATIVGGVVTYLAEERGWGINLAWGGVALAFSGILGAYHKLRLARDELQRHVLELETSRAGVGPKLPSCLALVRVEPRRGERPGEIKIWYEFQFSEEFSPNAVLEVRWTAPLVAFSTRLVSPHHEETRTVKRLRKQRANIFSLWFPGPPVPKGWLLQLEGEARDEVWLEEVEEVPAGKDQFQEFIDADDRAGRDA